MSKGSEQKLEKLEQRVKALEAWQRTRLLEAQAKAGVFSSVDVQPMPQGEKVWLVYDYDDDNCPRIRHSLEEARHAVKCDGGLFIREAILLGRVE